jgi:hypothetical protein
VRPLFPSHWAMSLHQTMTTDPFVTVDEQDPEKPEVDGSELGRRPGQPG